MTTSADRLFASSPSLALAREALLVMETVDHGVYDDTLLHAQVRPLVAALRDFQAENVRLSRALLNAQTVRAGQHADIEKMREQIEQMGRNAHEQQNRYDARERELNACRERIRELEAQR